MAGVVVDVEAPDLVVRVGGLNRVLAFRGTVRVALADVTAVHVGPAPPPRGLRAPGTGWPFRPGRTIAGTFRRRGAKEFHVVHRGERALVVDLCEKAPWRRLVLEIDDADEVAQRLCAARFPI